jgi:hypothetical protein
MGTPHGSVICQQSVARGGEAGGRGGGAAAAEPQVRALSEDTS